LQEAHAARGAVAAVPAATTAAAAPDLVRVDAHRVAPLEDPGVGEARIGHVRLHRVGAVETLARAGAAGDGLGVLVALVADGDLHADHRAVVHLVGELSVPEHADHAPHALLGVVLDVPHVRPDHVEAEMRDHAAQLLHALLVGGDLRAQVGDVLVGIAR